MAKFLVTGGAGFVGSNLISRLISEGHNATVIDNFSNGLVSNIGSSSTLLRADLCDESWTKELTGEKFDAVIHCAAQASNATSFKDPYRDLEVNQLSTLRVLKFCEQESISRLIFTSSMSVYGNPSTFPTPPSTHPNPETYYAIHKAASEGYIKLSKNLNWTIFRLYTTYGAGQNLANQEQGLVKIFLSYILKGERVKVHGSVGRIRDIVHVSDVVDAIYQSAFNEKSYSNIYNLGSGTTITVAQIIDKLYEQMGIGNPPEVLQEAADIGDPFKTHADISASQTDLNWNPKISPDKGIALTAFKYKLK